jgi:hypothetical protein
VKKTGKPSSISIKRDTNKKIGENSIRRKIAKSLENILDLL